MEKETEILAKLNIIEQQNKKIQKRLLMNNIFNVIRIIIIIAPIILGIIYLPPLIKNLLEKYNEIAPQLDSLNLPDLKQLIK